MSQLTWWCHSSRVSWCRVCRYALWAPRLSEEGRLPRCWRLLLPSYVTPLPADPQSDLLHLLLTTPTDDVRVNIKKSVKQKNIWTFHRLFSYRTEPVSCWNRMWHHTRYTCEDVFHSAHEPLCFLPHVTNREVKNRREESRDQMRRLRSPLQNCEKQSINRFVLFLQSRVQKPVL